MKQPRSEKVVLVTGAAGLVGNGIRLALAQDSRSDERYVFAMREDADLLVKAQVVELFRRTKPTHVISCGAKVGGLFGNMAGNLEFLRENYTINDNILSTAQEFGVKKVVTCLSTCIFPDKTTYPIDESMMHQGPPHPSNFGFAYAKRMVDVLNRAYNEKHGTCFTSVIPSNVFGTHDNFSIKNGHVLPGLIHKLYNCCKTTPHQPFTVWGTGSPLRQFIFNEDLARIILWAMREYEETAPITAAPDEADEVSIRQVAETVADAFGFKGEWIFDTSKSDGQYKKTASNAKLRRYLPDFKFTPFKEAVAKSVQWFNDNYETARK